MKANQSFFEQINDVKQVIHIFERASAQSVTILLKIMDPSSDRVYMGTVLQFHRINEQMRLYIDIKEATDDFWEGKAVFGIFNIEDSKMIFWGKTENKNRSQYIVIKPEIFKIQRREFFRLKLPNEIRYRAQILSPKVRKRVWVSDLSAGGIAFTLDDRETYHLLKQHSEIEFKLLLPYQNFDPLKAKIVRSSDSQMRLGLKFVFSDKEMEQSMFGYVTMLWKLDFLK
ncbi:MAG: PilZ domain-containing protein [Bdellovibrionaceae bacterium]|nr:PilZ domain-containing protein [Pseudobdellovibrionaceae bacterium]MDW8190461.1 PilZ domain-containing protein [Pseudobdellovibrionaceae bacterium]